LDVLFDQVSAFVPEKMKSTLQAFRPETLSDPKDRLADILKQPNPEKRDLRLVRLVSELMDHTEGVDSQKELDLASEAISQFSDLGLKMTFADFLTITRLNSLVKLKKLIDAQRLAVSISSEETRAWAMLALAAAAKEDPVLAFELTSNALKVLDAASPNPEKVELALKAAALLAKDDP